MTSLTGHLLQPLYIRICAPSQNVLTRASSRSSGCNNALLPTHPSMIQHVILRTGTSSPIVPKPFVLTPMHSPRLCSLNQGFLSHCRTQPHNDIPQSHESLAREGLREEVGYHVVCRLAFHSQFQLPSIDVVLHVD